LSALQGYTIGGNVGIGTNNPQYKLDVNGGIGNFSTASNTTLFVRADATATYASDSGQLLITGKTNTNLRLGMMVDTTQGVCKIQGGEAGIRTLPLTLNSGGGAVGIGTTNPLYTLDVNGGMRVGEMRTNIQPCKLVIEQGGGVSSNGLFISNTNYGSMQGLNISMVNAGSGNFNSYASIQGYTSGVSGTTHLSLQPTGGAVGIGITNPAHPLQVFGGTAYTNTSLEDAVAAAGSVLAVNTKNSLPTSTGNYLPVLMLGGSVGNNSFLNMFKYRYATGNGWGSASTVIQQAIDGTNMAYIEFNPPGAMAGLGLYTGSSGRVASMSPNGITILQNGNVGIGIANPSSKLQVNGSMNLGGDTVPSVGLTFTKTPPNLPTPSWIAFGTGTNTIATSTNGIDWAPQGTSVFSDDGYGAAWNGSMWVAVGAGANSIATSSNGINWTGVTGRSIFSGNGRGVAWNGSMWVAVGAADGGGANTIATSTDGVNWTGRGKTIFPNYAFNVAWNGTIWVALGQAGSHTIATSTDGINWTGQGMSIFSIYGFNAAWNGTMWVAVGNGTNSIATSTNGINWTTRSATNAIFSTGLGVAWNGSMWVAVGAGTNNTIATSTNGIDWTGRGNTIFTGQGVSVAWNGTRWVAIGQGTNTIATSTNGIDWTGLGTTIFPTYGRGLAATMVYTNSSATLSMNSSTRNQLDVAGSLGISGGITPTYSTPSFGPGQVGYQVVSTTNLIGSTAIPNGTSAIVVTVPSVPPGVYLVIFRCGTNCSGAYTHCYIGNPTKNVNVRVFATGAAGQCLSQVYAITEPTVFNGILDDSGGGQVCYVDTGVGLSLTVLRIA
jgi:hypothetical protein